MNILTRVFKYPLKATFSAFQGPHSSATVFSSIFQKWHCKVYVSDVNLSLHSVMEGGADSAAIDVEIDNQMTEAIKIIMSGAGVQIQDPESIKLVKLALKKKIGTIASTAHFYASNQDPNDTKTLQMSHLKPALAELGIKIDRPDYIIEQQQSKMATRRPKSLK